MQINILQNLEQTITNPSVNNEIVQSFLCYLVQVIMARVGDKVDTNTGNNIVKLIIQIFEHQQKVTEYGLMAY